MTRKITALSIIATLSLASTAEAIDFTPQSMTQNADGILIHRTYFSDGAVNYGIKVPGSTMLTAQENRALFKFTDFTYASMIWRPSSFTPAVPFDTAHLPSYAAAAMQFLPQGSSGAKVVGEEDNVYPINNWICHRYTITYQFFGYSIRETVTFLNLNDKEQFVIQVSSRARDVDAVTKRSWDIIRSWHEIEPQTGRRSS